MRLTKKDMEIRRDRMIQVAYKLFSEYGIEGTSLERVAKEAGASPKSIFRYFENKAQLVEQTQIILWEEIVNCVTTDNQPALSKATNGLEEMEVLLLGFENLYKNHKDYLLFSNDYQSYLMRKHKKLSQEHLERMLSDVRPIFLHALERGQQDGSISNHRPASEQFLLIWGIMRTYVDQLVIHSQLYEGENIWTVMFPELIVEMLNILK